jgi:hypothetical protein
MTGFFERYSRNFKFQEVPSIKSHVTSPPDYPVHQPAKAW